jgi:hypothetical protein
VYNPAFNKGGEMGENWSLSQEEEDLHRQGLFRKARKGDEKAKQELQEVYGVRLWTEQERATLVYENPRHKAKRGTQKS